LESSLILWQIGEYEAVDGAEEGIGFRGADSGSRKLDIKHRWAASSGPYLCSDQTGSWLEGLALVDELPPVKIEGKDFLVVENI